MTTSRWLAAAAITLAVLVATASLGGIFVTSVYARETAMWAAQGVGQDWIDLVLVAPLLLGCGIALARGSRRALLVLAGAAIYVGYSFVVYAFAVHFNALFLIYCGTLGVAFYVLLAALAQLRRAAGWFDDEPLRFGRAGGVFLIVVAAAFGLMWLSAVVPALLHGAPPAGLDEVGLITNPVYVLDLAIVLPGLAACGVLLVARRPAGAVLGPILATFTVLMAAALIGMFAAMRVRGLAAGLDATLPAVVLCATGSALLAAWLPAVRPS